MSSTGTRVTATHAHTEAVDEALAVEVLREHAEEALPGEDEEPPGSECRTCRESWPCVASRLATAVLATPHKAAALCDAAQGRNRVRERLATAEQLRQDIGRISARHADGIATPALAVALADAGWVKVPLAETSEGR